MKKILSMILLYTIMIIGVTGCTNYSKELGDEPLLNSAELILSIAIGNKSCTPVKLSSK